VIYPESFEKKTGFDKIILQVKDLCLSELGSEKADDIRFSNSFNKIQNQLDLTNEFMNLMQFGKSFPSQDYFNLIPELERIRTEGTFIDLEKLKKVN